MQITSLRRASLSRRVFVTTLLCTFGVGYLMALVYLYAQEMRPAQLAGHGLVQGVANTYHGVPNESPLLVSLRGSMASTSTPEDVKSISEWIEAGAKEETYGDVVGPIIESSCVTCHDAEGAYYPPLATYAQVAEWAKPGGGMAIQRLARMTHIHLLGIPMLLFIMGWMFVQTRYGEWLKAALIVLPFLGVLFDVAHWWITKFNPDAAAGVILGGVLMNLGYAAQWILTAWDTWAPLKQEDR